MRLIPLIVCTCALLASTPLAYARPAGQDRPGPTVSGKASNGDGPERIGPRQQAVARTPSLLSTNRWSEMLLKDDAVYLQLTDYGMKQVGEPQDTRNSDEGVLGNIIKAMALGGVKALLDHSLALSLTDMRTARVRDGEVILVTCQGKEVFNKVKINDQVQKFQPDQAEDFVKSINRLRQKLPACGS
ncbi:hypothetical protein [Massilia sp. DWR3-1-1]|uniref:hypothetical protein n=1 Tax=Massilia sp. DWR3-1-1 TaxID=2804559 RepID=UPI003CED1D3A